MAIEHSTKSSKYNDSSDSDDNDFYSKEFNAFSLYDSEHNCYSYQLSDFKNPEFYDCKSIWKNAEYLLDSQAHIKLEDNINIELKGSFLFPKDHLLILISEEFIHVINMKLNKKLIQRFLYDDIIIIRLIHKIYVDPFGISILNRGLLILTHRNTLHE